MITFLEVYSTKYIFMFKSGFSFKFKYTKELSVVIVRLYNNGFLHAE